MLSLSNPQSVFLSGLNTKYRAYVGGFGSGKTFVGCLDLLIFAGQHPGTIQGYFGPTYPAIRDIFYPTLTEAAEMMGYRVQVMESNKEVHLYRGAKYYGTIICRSMDNPNSIVGFKIARALVDEIDVLAPDKANNAWNKIIARMRLVIPGVVNGISVTTTPEGFKWVHSAFANDPKPSYSMVQASTYENADYLPPDYIETLIETYPPQLISAYLNGEFVNLTSGSVYNAYDRLLCSSKETIGHGERLYIGQDFNVGKMASVVYVKRGDVFHGVEELVDLYDTPALILAIDARYKGHTISLYPDASGNSRKTNDASTSDIAMLRQAGYDVRVNGANPAVRDRILAVNAGLSHGKIKINTAKCPEFVRCLEQQSYDKNGEPDKKNGFDHMNDAGGYPIAYEMPIRKPIANVNVSFAL
jgi:hypothetical protein